MGYFCLKQVLNYRSNWLATASKVRTKLLSLNGDIFIPEWSL